MKKQILAVCDAEAEYTQRFCDYVGKKKDYPFRAAAFSSVETLRRFCGEEEVAVLLISEQAYEPSLKEIVKGGVLVLREEPDAGSGEGSVYKYQPCENVLREIMQYCAESGAAPIGSVPPVGVSCGGLRLIGLYTPVHRCMQTTFSMTLGEALAKRHKVLYLNFESFSGLEKRLQREFMTDMSDLVYYMTNAREAFFYKLKGMTQTLQRLDYIPPVFSFLDLARVTPQQWIALFQEIERLTAYEYLILDLSAHMQGLFDILRMCEKVFTLVREDDMALAKLQQYETLLERTEYEDILQKTRRCRLPRIRNVPVNFLELTHSDLADYVGRLVREEFYGGQ